MKAIIYTKANCPFCVKAKGLLSSLAIEYDEKPIISKEDPTRAELVERMGLPPEQRLFVPQIWIDDNYIGGYDGLTEWKDTLS